MEQLKQRLRMEMKQRLAAMSQAEKAVADEAIYNQIIGLDEVRRARVACVYVSMKAEVDTKKIIKFLLNKKKRVVVPRIIGKELDLIEIKSLNDLQKGKRGFKEPKLGVAVDNETMKQWDNGPDVFIVPGLAFDKEGNRLGRGGGYYDRLLVGVGGYKIGLAYSCQMVDKLVQMAHDIKMDKVVVGK